MASGTSKVGGRSMHRARTLLIGAAVVASTGFVATPAGAATTANLIKNPGAEGSVGGTGGPVPVASWTRKNGGTATAVKYGTPNFPTVHSVGPAVRGKNLFAGGNDDTFTQHELYQSISLAPYVAKIKGGHVTFSLSGFFGGFATQDDNASLLVEWHDASGTSIGSQLVGGVLAAARNNTTGMRKRTVTAAVPAAARSAVVIAIFDRFTGYYNDGYSDNLSLVLGNV
jgi:hypothetical protein